MTALAVVISPDAPRYDLIEGGVLRGSLETAPPRAARVLTAAGEWEIGLHHRHGGWYAVAMRPGAAEADAAYYPRWLPGGTIAFADRRYSLRGGLLQQHWRLRDEERTAIARIGPLPRPRRGRGVPVDRAVELDPLGAGRPEIWLLLLFALWAILMEPPYMPS